MAKDKEKVKIEKFDGDRFHSWQELVKWLVASHAPPILDKSTSLNVGCSRRPASAGLHIEFFSLEFKQGLMTPIASIEAINPAKNVLAILLKAVKGVFPTLVTTPRNIPNPTWEGVIQ